MQFAVYSLRKGLKGLAKKRIEGVLIQAEPLNILQPGFMTRLSSYSGLMVYWL